jgi:predicted glycosyltransferase
MNRYRLLIYSQSLWGLGHLIRGIALANALVKEFQVCLVTSLPVKSCFSLDNRFQSVFLSPLRLDLMRPAAHPLDIDEDLAYLISMDPQLTTIEAIQNRQRQIEDIFSSFDPHVVITEYYPFGRWALGMELLPSLEVAKQKGKKIICAVRDILKPINPDYHGTPQQIIDYNTKFNNYYLRAIDLLNTRFDALFVHSDKSVLPLSKSILCEDKIRIPVEYTGYISSSLAFNLGNEVLSISEVAITPYIVLAAGGGFGERDFFLTWIPALDRVRKEALGPLGKIVILCGPQMGKAHYSRVKLEEKAWPNITIRRYCNSFQRLIDQAALLVCRAGYNTSFNVLNSQVPTVMVPGTKVSDQVIRAECFANLGIVQCCRLEQGFDALVQISLRALLQKKKERRFNIDGGHSTCRLVKNILKG